MTGRGKEEGDKYEDARDNMEDVTAASTPDKHVLTDDVNTSAQQNDGQLDRTRTTTSNSLGSPTNSLGDTEQPL